MKNYSWDEEVDNDDEDYGNAENFDDGDFVDDDDDYCYEDGDDYSGDAFDDDDDEKDYDDFADHDEDVSEINQKDIWCLSRAIVVGDVLQTVLFIIEVTD